MVALLDVNLLLALMDPAHVSHADAHRRFARTRRDGWASCPITQNGVVRIASQPAYPNSPGGPAAVGAVLARFLSDTHHEFWSDDVSLLDSKAVELSEVVRSADVTDSYLLALAARHRGTLATLDARLRATGVPGGARSLAIVVSK